MTIILTPQNPFISGYYATKVFTHNSHSTMSIPRAFICLAPVKTPISSRISDFFIGLIIPLIFLSPNTYMGLEVYKTFYFATLK